MQLSMQLQDRAGATQAGSGGEATARNAGAGSTEEIVRELRERCNRLSHAYLEGKHEYLTTQGEMERRDALHNELVQKYQKLAEEKNLAVLKVDRLHDRIVHILEQRDELQSNLTAADARHKLAEMRRERDDAKDFLVWQEDRNSTLVEQIKTAEKIIGKLVKQLNKK